MAKFVLAGCEGCLGFARLELLADILAARLPHFNVNKVVKSSDDWPTWLAAECDTHGWSHSGGSPLIWRELVDTGGKGLYLGGLKEFEDYIRRYYAIIPSPNPELEALIAAENRLAFEKKWQELAKSIPEVLVKVCVTNANSSLCYQLTQLVATGAVLGSTRVALHLYHQDEDKTCEGIAMELQDLASPELAYVKTTSSLSEALDGVELVFLMDWIYNAANLKLCSPDSDQWKEVMGRVGSLYRDYAQGLEAWASNNVKVCVTGCVANVGVAVMAASAPALSKSCIATPCLAESQARAVLGQKLCIHNSNISKVIIWGRTHGHVLPDDTFTRVRHFPGAVVGPGPCDFPLSRCEFNKKWLMEEFPHLVALRHQLLEGYREDGPAMAEAVALAGLARRWVQFKEEDNNDKMEEEDDKNEAEEKLEKEGVEYKENEHGECKEEEQVKENGKEEEEKKWGEEDEWWGVESKETWCSVGVVIKSNLCYNIPKGLAVSLPCQCRHGKWKPVLGLQLTKHIQDGLASQVEQLQHELETALTAL